MKCHKNLTTFMGIVTRNSYQVISISDQQFSGRVALVVQRPIVVKLSRGRSVGLSVRTYVRRSVGRSVQWIYRPVHCGKTTDRIRMPFGIIGRTGPRMADLGLGIGPRERVLLGANLGLAIVTNGDFTAYVCDSAATRPSSQITLGKLVFFPVTARTQTHTKRQGRNGANGHQPAYKADFLLLKMISRTKKHSMCAAAVAAWCSCWRTAWCVKT